MFEATILLKNLIPKDPGKIVTPISKFIGFFLNHIYNFVSNLSTSEVNTLGISIILLTCFVRIVMLPLAVKSQKSMMAMQKLQPEMEKIKVKYGDSKDPEVQRKMNQEVSMLYSKHKANPLMGCLPLFIQMPVFMAMYYIMNQPYRFIDKLGAVYLNIADIIMEIPMHGTILDAVGYDKIPKGMNIAFQGASSEIVPLLSKFLEADWANFLAQIPSEFVSSIEGLLNTKWNIEQLFSINLTENTGLYWPAIIIPVISVLATFASSYLSNKQSKTTDPAMAMQQKMMLFGMPIMMGFFTMNIPGGVGLYWITSNIFQVVQQVVLQKVFAKNDEKESLDLIDKKKNKTVVKKKK